MKSGCSGFSFIEIIPSLRHVIFVIQLYRQVCIVPVVWCLHSGHACKRKRQTVLFQVADGACYHLGLVPCNAVVSRNQVVAVDREHRNHCF